MNYLFGPVNSRRLGRSLGIDLFAHKICNLNCIYCEVGLTRNPVCQRAIYTPTQAILDEITAFCLDPKRLAGIDVFTVTAKGEPTLHLGFKEILCHIKKLTDTPLAVLTNGTTLMFEDVRQALQLADIVIPSLDSAREESFRKVDRPVAGMFLQDIIQGMMLFSREYRGKIWLEILLCRGMNDSQEDLDALVVVIRRMNVERVQLNTVLRPAPELFALPLCSEELERIACFLQGHLGLPVDWAPNKVQALTDGPVLSLDDKTFLPEHTDVLAEIVRMVSRRPCSAVDIDRSFSLGGPDKIRQLLEPLVTTGVLQVNRHGGTLFYQAK